MGYRPGRISNWVGVLLVGLLAASVGVPRAIAAPAKSMTTASSYFVYVGTYTGPTSKGIYGFRFDPKTGKLTPTGLVAELANPSWLVTDPQHRFLYAATEMGPEPGADNYKKNGSISSYSINPKTGALTFLNKVDAGGGGSCHLVVDKTGKMLFVANYGSGNVASFAIKADGSIGERTGFDQHTGSSVDPARQTGPHAHAVVLSPDNRFLFVPDLGLDQIKIYRVDAAKGTFTPNDPPFATVKAGLGPRHFTFGRGAKFAYAICEMGSSVAVFAYDPAKGSLTPLQTISTLPSGLQRGRQLGRDRSRPVRAVSVCLQSRERQHHCICHRSRQGNADQGSSGTHARKDSQKFRHRSHGQIPGGGEPGIRSDGCFCRGSEQPVS